MGLRSELCAINFYTKRRKPADQQCPYTYNIAYLLICFLIISPSLLSHRTEWLVGASGCQAPDWLRHGRVRSKWSVLFWPEAQRAGRRPHCVRVCVMFTTLPSQQEPQHFGKTRKNAPWLLHTFKWGLFRSFGLNWRTTCCSVEFSCLRKEFKIKPWTRHTCLKHFKPFWTYFRWFSVWNVCSGLSEGAGVVTAFTAKTVKFKSLWLE